MELKTYRARTMHEALALVRRELGPDAAVLDTREVQRGRRCGWLAGERQIEVTASAEVNVPSRLPPRRRPRSRSGRRGSRRSAASIWQRSPRAVRWKSRHRQLGAPCPKSRPRRTAGGPRGVASVPPAVRRFDRHRNPRRTWPASWSQQAMHGLRPQQRDELETARSALAATIAGGIAVADPIQSLPASGGWWRWSGRPASARRRPSPSWRPHFRLDATRPGRSDHGRHLSHGGGRTVADLCRDHRSADGSRFGPRTGASPRSRAWPI